LMGAYSVAVQVPVGCNGYRPEVLAPVVSMGVVWLPPYFLYVLWMRRAPCSFVQPQASTG
jgi:hypothetical protein